VNNLIGRQKELTAIQNLLSSPKSEFLAIYGRRRVGKTFLVRESFNGEFSFYVTAMANTAMRQQLANFGVALKKYGAASPPKDLPKTWLDAFVRLGELLEKRKDKKKKVVFIDELPWFDTPRSSFISALEHFWNSWASARNDIVLVVCGSAASWMINKLIRNTGGLYNRVTKRIKLEPFSLHETELFLQYKGALYDRYQIIELYMTMGGIPYYLDQVNVSLSVAQNIDQLFFNSNGLLHQEFEPLYKSLFKYSETHIRIIETLSSKAMGLTRNKIIAKSGLPESGTMTRALRELEDSGFIRKYLPFKRKERSSLYQLVDFYSFFYLKFLGNNFSWDIRQWMNGLDHPRQRAWAGYAFEQVCLAHVDQIKQGLGIAGIQSAVSSWTGEGAQIDLIIDRRDRIINLCEMKFSTSMFVINKTYAQQLKNKISAFRESLATSEPLFLTMITTFGVKRNEYAVSLVQNEVTMDVLFVA
jgi:AAA+ ATPase superfamily predicted ATPase